MIGDVAFAAFSVLILACLACLVAAVVISYAATAVPHRLWVATFALMILTGVALTVGTAAEDPKLAPIPGVVTIFTAFSFRIALRELRRFRGNGRG